MCLWLDSIRKMVYPEIANIIAPSSGVHVTVKNKEKYLYVC